MREEWTDMPPIENKEEILSWYKNFQKQMKEEFGLDLNRKTDLFRIRRVYRREADFTPDLQYPFMRKNPDGGYAVPEPTLDYDEAEKLVGMYDALYRLPADAEERGRTLRADIEHAAERALAARNQWAVENQSVLYPEREEDFAQIARMYEDAKNGNLVLISKDSFGDSSTMYLGDDGKMHLTVPASARPDEYEYAPGRRTAMQTLFRAASIGRKEITDSMKPSEKDAAVKQNQYLDYLDRVYPDRPTVTPQEYRLLSSVQTAIKDPFEMPDPVPKPGFMAYLRWIFSGFRDNSEYTAYNEYVARRAEITEKKAAVDRVSAKYEQMEKKLVAAERLVSGAADEDRAYRIYANKEAFASAYSHPELTEAERLFASAQERYGENNEIMQQQFNEILDKDAVRLLSETANHPEYFNPNGTRTAAGRTAYKNRTCTPEEKEAVLNGYREQLDKAKQEALDALEKTFEGEYAAAHTAENAPFEQTLGILLYINAMQERTQKGELFRECEMKADDIKATGRAMTGTGAFRALTAEMADIRQYVYDFAEMERTAPHDLKAEYAVLSGKLAAHRKALAGQPKKDAPEKQAEKAVEEPKLSVPSNGI